ncbi:LacI family transcriptional regulator [Longibacter salinarum]|uniref:LacI family transcriptional regulator n=1 Tax=Longibacter salinarum TaxID=1850348 RepID=A0A2A8CVU3_9BACT|nr:LacI family DNA-binding transcriptional regulator [Longibacter salinarum]PEN12766.1 LacI family transcriptional regulator [Longibacter salinarum]
MAVTIRDVASEANVSATTVSRVFNHTDLVRPETVERVRRIADEMGYQPNATAKSLSHGRTDAIGVVLPAPHGEFFSEVMRGIDEVAQSSHYHLLISSSHYNRDEAEAAMRALSGRVDGLLVMTTHVEADDILQTPRPDVPVVFMNSSNVGPDHDAYDIENREGAYKATKHLIERGYRNIGVITGPRNSLDVQERLSGFRDALSDSGRNPSEAPVIDGDFTRASGYEAGKQILELDPRPDAFFSCNDYMAIGAISAFQEAGITTPGDIAIAGFDDIPSARYASPPLTTVRVPVFDLGRRAAQRLLDRMAGHSEMPIEEATLGSELVIRSST